MNTPGRRGAAFTLIELLAVIAIIGIIAGMVVHLAPAVNQNKKRQRVEAEKQKLVLFIDTYQSKFGHYPPDNPALAGGGFTAAQYDRYTQIHPLLYELTGGSNSFTGTAIFTAFHTNFPQTEFTAGYNLAGIVNSDADRRVVHNPLPSPRAYLNYPAWTAPPPAGPGTRWPGSTAASKDLQGLIVPVEMTQADDGANQGLAYPRFTTATNFWHYDASSTNRHNMNGYDLWAEFVVGRDHTNGWIYVTNGTASATNDD